MTNNTRHNLTPRTENAISQMLYDEIRQMLLAKYDIKNLKHQIPYDFKRKYIRTWLRNPTPNWIFREYQDSKKYGKLWAIRKAVELLISHDEIPLDDWMNDNIHNTFSRCCYITGSHLDYTYTNERDEDINFYLLSL